VLAKVLIPALALLPANVSMSQQVWSVMCLLPYPRRFAIYTVVQGESKQQLLVRAANELALREYGKVARRLRMPKKE
jgi:hypothetical protein